MITTEGKNNGTSLLLIQTTRQRHGAGIILAIFGILFLLGTGAAQRAQAQTTYTILHSFEGSPTDGSTPNAGVTVGKDGNLYGTTISGGYGAGTIFKVDAAGNESVIFRFPFSIYYSYGGKSCSLSPVIYGPDGLAPYAPLVMGPDGNLFGTTAEGGAKGYECNLGGLGTSGNGAVFELNLSSSAPAASVVYSFSHLIGTYGSPGLAVDSAGNLYGISMDGGAENVFKLDTSGDFSVLVSSAGGSTVVPIEQLIVDGAGNLYGVNPAAFVHGAVFELVNSHGTYTEKVLYTFSGGSDGSIPSAPLIMDAAGNLYGVTVQGGDTSLNNGVGAGTVFELVNSSGSYTERVLYAFTGGSGGARPSGRLVLDAAGNIYGTALSGGDTSLDNGFGGGAVFEVTPSGQETVLHSFGSVSGDGIDGEGLGGLTMDAAGNLYGTTPGGGEYGHGIVFKVTTPQLGVLAALNQVNALFSQRAINKGQHNSLVKKLQHAIAMINAGKIHGAIGNLEGFIGHVNALENSRRLTGAQASTLINAAKSVIAQLI